ncbi:MAG: Lin0512 family protein [Chloroflexi bacterium]|nr:Lin0512 family protein [Chloroflexota bacterium]
MAIRRCLVELGTGVDLEGKDPTKAARRAVADALRHGIPDFPTAFGHDLRLIYVEVNVAVPHCEDVRPGEVLLEAPYGRRSINVVEGGMEAPALEEGGDPVLVANAAVVVSLYVPEEG